MLTVAHHLVDRCAPSCCLVQHTKAATKAATGYMIQQQQLCFMVVIMMTHYELVLGDVMVFSLAAASLCNTHTRQLESSISLCVIARLVQYTHKATQEQHTVCDCKTSAAAHGRKSRYAAQLHIFQGKPSHTTLLLF